MSEIGQKSIREIRREKDRKGKKTDSILQSFGAILSKMSNGEYFLTTF